MDDARNHAHTTVTRPPVDVTPANSARTDPRDVAWTSRPSAATQQPALWEWFLIFGGGHGRNGGSIGSGDSNLLTLTEIVDLLGGSRRRLQELCQEGLFPSAARTGPRKTWLVARCCVESHKARRACTAHRKGQGR